MASLLLRLFNSKQFSPQHALSYLRTYSDNIGITYYLVAQLESAFEPEEVEFYWPQLCHLLITRPSESRALECFILRRCSQSVHVALLTLWYFQAALSDLSSNPHTASFHICHRVFNQCQRILFEDPLSSSNSVYALSTAAATSQNAAGPSGSNLLQSGLQSLLAAASSLGRQKVSSQAPLANIVGIGSVMASVPAMPSLAGITGSIAIEQARRPPDAMQDALAARDAYDHEEDGEVYGSGHGPSGEDDAADSSDNDSLDEKTTSTRDAAKSSNSRVMSRADTAPLPPPKDRPAPASPSKEVTSGGSLPVAPAAKKVDNPFATFAAGFNAGFLDLSNKAAAAVSDVFGQTQDEHVSSNGTSTASKKKQASGKVPPPWSPSKHRQLASVSHSTAPSRSVPNLITSRGSVSSVFASSATLDQSGAKTEAILALYNAEARRSLLRSNYCKVQTQFLLSLQDISARLLLIPKPARVSALRAELTALNHKLPADVCFPLWCTADDRDVRTAFDGRTQTRRHHRVIRINPSEAVVLNSADRVPFLLHVEVLNNDLDFDPDRRQNRETLRRLVTEEDVRRRKVAAASSGRSSFVQSTTEHARRGSDFNTDAQVSTPDAVQDSESPGQVTRTSTPKPQSRPFTPPIEREVQPERRAQNASGGTNIPPDDGEEMDLTEQMYGSDLAGFGGDHDSSDDEDLASRNRMHDTAAWTSAPSGTTTTTTSSVTGGTGTDEQLGAGHRPMKEFSLDEYAQRMRTAAIMLSQLNKSTNASKAQAIINYGPSLNAQGGWSSWIVPTNWYSSSAPAANGGGGGAGDKSEIGQGSAGVSTHVKTSIDSTRVMAGMPMGGGGGGSRLVHAETEAIRKRIMEEMMALEEERMRRMKAGGRQVSASRARKSAGQMAEDEEEAVLRAVNKDDPSAAMFSESWAAKKQRIRASSPYGHLANWDVFSVIVKTGADLRQEQLAVQLINEFGRIWQETGSKCWVRYFRILVTSENSGLMETITDAVSVHSIKKEAYSRMKEEDKAAGYTLYDHFLAAYGPPTSAGFVAARDRFMRSLAGYSIISYLLQIKDRHNGNILVDNEGRLIHIDFGFMLGISPGGVGFEAAPFKMPQEYIDILGGLESRKFDEFKQLMRKGFRDVRAHAERIIMLVELMSKDSKLPCFALGDLTASNLRDRFQLGLSREQCDEFVDRLVLASAGSAFTRLYDVYQRMTEGVL
ncbi:Phosphatidylinositol 3-/4-kinase, catalytic domain protein [Kalmanozyma brasiliensis GHG001]|uniref:1-phosphatidylinositol 4-kinase n=1 Tax=Kalmanozyma brasiliensis (strain GHG001) TaxID=1365824 RepID=V5F1P6_KALBG|nr:Phosphatidylinositol 3-/4-kinase, catalytic domain protein [Kalmanozyma brasiliensis GHG001]EST09239.1 Phosphatidylinositol 3-/4-kinase, catalytic domain protein [Kalmanozyma brasiliensis GHG001]